MIHVNLMELPPGFAIPRKKASRSSTLPILLSLFFCVIVGGVGWFFYAGVPQSILLAIPEALQDYLPSMESVLDGPSTVQTPPQQPATSQGQGLPVDPVAQVAPVRPKVVSDAAIEEIVRTLRPDIAVERKPSTYRELLPAERIHQQKAMLREGFMRFRTLTPTSVGFVDLAFKIPDLYYARGLSTDARVLGIFTDSLKSRMAEFKTVPPPESGSSEFTFYGRLRLPPPTPGEKLSLLTQSEVSAEIEQIRELARKLQVRLTGLDKSTITDQGLYRRYVVQGQTRSDFPTVARFAEAFANSVLRVGILQVGMRPSADESLLSTFDFVLYATP